MTKYVLSNELSDKFKSDGEMNFNSFAKYLTKEEYLNKESEYYIPKLKDCVILIVGLNTWHDIKDLHDSGEIHIGLRNFTFTTVNSMPYVSIANNVKLVCSYGYVNGELDTKFEMFKTSNFDKPIPQLESYDIIFDITKINEYIKKLEELNPKGEEFGFDFETRGFPLRKGFKPLGFSLCGSKYGFYVDFRNLTDWTSDKFSFIKRYIEENYKRLITFNCKFEIAVTEHMWGEKLRYQDAMVMLLCDDYRPNRKTVPGLKPSAQKFLQVPSWDDDLEFEQMYFSQICSNYKGPEEFLKDLNNNTEIKIPKKPSIFILSDLKRIMEEAIERRFADFDYSDSEKELISKEIRANYKERILTAWGNEWEMSDPYTLGKYCIYDSFYTKLIWDYFKGQYKKAVPIYSGNYHYGSFIEDTAIPINRQRLNILKNYSETVKINSGIYLAKFYLMCLEDTVGHFVDTELRLNEFTKNLIIDYPKLISEQSDKVLKELIKNCTPLDTDYKDCPISSVKWKDLLKYMSKETARKLWSLVKSDDTIGSACRRHRKEWISIGEDFAKDNPYSGLIETINDRNLKICRESMKQFNQEIIEFVYPHDPNDCKLVSFYFEDAKLKKNPFKVLNDYPHISKRCFEFVRKVQKEWDDSYWKEHYLEGKPFKKMFAYINKSLYQKDGVGYFGSSDLENWRHSYDLLDDVPPIMLLYLPVDEIITVKEVVNLISIRKQKSTLDKWDSIRLDDKIPSDVKFEYAKWLTEDMVQWSSDDDTRTVVFTILKKYGWLCSAVTQFWNWWWSPDHEKEHEKEVLEYSIKTARENRNNWIIDVQDYFYGAGKQAKKDNRAVDITGFCVRFGFEHDEIREFHMFDITKDTKLNLEYDDDPFLQDWKNLYKFFHSWEFYSACTKQLNPYLTRMDEDCGQVVETTRDGCEVIEPGIKGNRFLTQFKICQVISKRTSGFFHTIELNVA